MSRNESVNLFVVERIEGMTSSERSHVLAAMVQETAMRATSKNLKMLIVTSSPKGAQSVVLKHWHSMRRKLEREKALTLDMLKRKSIDDSIKSMSALTFSIKFPDDDDYGIFFISPAQLEDALRNINPSSV